MERELEKDLKEIEYLIYVHKNRGNTNTQSVLERVHEIIEPCAKAARTLSELEALLFRENGQGTTRSSRDKDGWISVEERLPEELAPVLVTACVPVRKPGWDKRKECCVVVDTDVYDPEIKHGWEHFKDKVTAWMPLPEPYQREEAINEKE